jgi:basic amino acid/polyamine antiporter, APA family
MARLRRHGLQRVLGVNALFSTAYGNVGSSIYYALGLVASFALGLTPLVFVITGAIFYLTAATYAEATAMFPEAGGSSSFARHAFNEFWSFFAAWAQMLNYVITIAISAFFVPHYLGGLFWGALRHGPGDILFGMGVVIFLSLLNVVGVKEAARVNIGLAVADFGTQLLLVIIGIALVLSPSTLVNNVHLGVAPTWKDFLIAIPVGMIAYTGIETISNMAEEARDESRTVPSAIRRVVAAVFIIYAALPVVALSALPVTRSANGHYSTLLGVDESQGGYAGDPVLGIVKNLHLGSLQRPGEIYVGLLAATILFIATNAGIIGVSRLVYSMGLHRQVPDRLRALHPRYNTPWIGILLFGAVACLVLIPGQATFLGNVYAFGAMLSFTIAHLAVIRLRVRDPDRVRPYRGPGTLRLGRYRLPLFAILGGLGTGLAFVVVTVLHFSVAGFGVGWLAFGTVGYVLYRRHLGLDLTTTVRAEVSVAPFDHEVEYESVLLVYDTRFDEDALNTAIRLAAHGKRTIQVLVLVEVPAALPISAPLPDQEASAETVLETARVRSHRRIGGHVEKVRARQAGRRIVEYAREMKASAIVMPAASGRGGATINETLQTVLRERPCRVIITSAPVAVEQEVPHVAAARA